MPDFLADLKPENIRAFALFFLLGFVFRSVERGVRGAPKEEEIRTAIMAVVWSIVLSAALPVVSRPQPSWVTSEYQTPVELASLILYAALVGFVWALLRPSTFGFLEDRKSNLKKWAKKSWWKWLCPILDSELHFRAKEQCAIGFLKSVDGATRVRVTLKSGKTYCGCVVAHDSSSEPAHPIYLILVHLMYLDDGWRELPHLSSMLVRLEDVEAIAIMEPAPIQPVAEPVSNESPSKQIESGVPEAGTRTSFSSRINRKQFLLTLAVVGLSLIAWFFIKQR
ncbi:MAG: hypothetical protein JNK63_08530 [Chthonomonas sp.]|nr:hypothetical protein [Chthonomonas sp.]